MRQIIENLLPKSESTLKKHNWKYNGLSFINDLGYPCEYRLERNGVDLKLMAKYYGGRLLATYKLTDK